MRGNPPGRPFRALAVLSAAFIGLACGGPNMNPSQSDARNALEVALSGWRSGKKPADIATSTSPVNVVDSEWTNGRELTEFQILGEEDSEADKRFKVKLVLARPAQEEEVVYIVLGADTKSVFRAEDYERTIHMDNNPAPKKRR